MITFSHYFNHLELHYSWIYILIFMYGIAWSQYPSLITLYTLLSLSMIWVFYAYWNDAFNFKIFIHYMIAYISFISGIALFNYHEKFYNYYSKTMQSIHSFSAKIIDIENWHTERTVLTLSLLKPAEGKIKIYIAQKYSLEIGDLLDIKNVYIKKPENSRFALYLKKEGLISSFFTNSLEYTLVKRPKFNVWQWINVQKSRIICSLKNKMSPSTQTLFFNIFLGSKASLVSNQEKIRTKFNNWGITHFLARSGLHLTCIAFILFFLLRIIPLHIALKNIFILCIITFYSLLSFTSISFMRALISYSLISLYITLNKPIKPLHIFFITLLLTLLYNPYQLFFIDFQLTFGITLLILLFASINLK